MRDTIFPHQRAIRIQDPPEIFKGAVRIVLVLQWSSLNCMYRLSKYLYGDKRNFSRRRAIRGKDDPSRQQRQQHHRRRRHGDDPEPAAADNNCRCVRNAPPRIITNCSSTAFLATGGGRGVAIPAAGHGGIVPAPRAHRAPAAAGPSAADFGASPLGGAAALSQQPIIMMHVACPGTTTGCSRLFARKNEDERCEVTRGKQMGMRRSCR